jgi:hypothetical protein
MTDDQLKQFVLDYCDGKIFTSNQIRNPNSVGFVFMPLIMGALEGYTEEERGKIAMAWEHLSKAGPRSINGMPMFASCHLMHKEDLDVVAPAITKELERRKNIEL